MIKDPLEQKRNDMALNLFGAVSIIINNRQLTPEDRTYLVEQLAKHYVYYYRYFTSIQEGGCPPNVLNQLSLKSKTAKNKVIAFIEQRYERTCSVELNKIFGDNWEHCITDGSIKYEH